MKFLKRTKTKTDDGGSKDFEISLGGFYAYKSKDSNEFSAVRLLDITADTVHYVIYETKFKEEPNAQDITSAKPFAKHIPQDIGVLLNWDNLKLVKKQKLESKDLEGYEYFLGEACGMADKDIKEYLDSLIELSGKVSTITLGLDNNEYRIINATKAE